ncbi:MAG: hypothetical protein CL677_00165 [Bdellovibrionaceae bacterium]|nr:hypothetical protein [Pseudobdellovibrionaceae bacterium]|tara:strand:+ start:98480 stop:99817 length:1338 start_codon:yes stop_codon:yes gene_type:complete
MKCIFTGFIVILLSHVLLAQDHCENLYSKACASKSVSQFDIETAIDKRSLKYKKTILKQLNDPDSAYFRKIALNIFGLEDHPSCVNGRKIEDCNQRVVNHLYSLAKYRISPSNTANLGSNADLEDIDYVLYNSTFEDLVRQIKGDLRKSLNWQNQLDKIEYDLFPKVERLLAQKITSLDIEDNQKKRMIEKIKSIRFDRDTCNPVSQGLDTSLNINFVSNAFYDPMANNFKICDGFLLNNYSDSFLVVVIAHELAHSIDPCNIQRGPLSITPQYSRKDIAQAETQYPITPLIKCLRNENSIAAKRYDGLLDYIGMATFGLMNPMFCEDDQIREGVPDWFAIEVLAEYAAEENPQMSIESAIDYYSKAYAGFCHFITSNTHPPSKDRVNDLTLAHPEVRKSLGCSRSKNSAGYCDGISSTPKLYGQPPRQERKRQWRPKKHGRSRR